MNTKEQMEALVKAAKAVATTFPSPEEQHAVDVALVQALAPFLPKPEKVYVLDDKKPVWFDDLCQEFLSGIEDGTFGAIDFWYHIRELTAKDAPKKKAREWWINIYTSGEVYAHSNELKAQLGLSSEGETIHVREVLP